MRARSWKNWLWVLVFAAVVAMPLVACQPDGPAEEAGEEIDDATGGDAMGEAGEAVDEAMDDAEEGMEETGDAMEDAVDGDG